MTAVPDPPDVAIRNAGAILTAESTVRFRLLSNTGNYSMKRLHVTSHRPLYACPPAEMFGYFGWPSLARLSDGSLVAAASGFRHAHICPFGKSVLFRSRNAVEWSAPEIINDSPVDDRDTGLLALDDKSFLLSWFGSDTRIYYPAPDAAYRPVLDTWEDDTVQQHIGSFLRSYSPAAGWGPVQRVKVTSPHGPIRLRNGDLFYLGTEFGHRDADGNFHLSMRHEHRITALRSADGGLTWIECGSVAFPEDPDAFFCEPHAIELMDGRLLGLLRRERDFSIWQTVSADGGASWSCPEFRCFGSPPQLLRHSSGILIASYGCRRAPFGQRVMFSTDEGTSWDTDWIIRDDAPDADLGYPCSVELDDGSILTLYYQHEPGNPNAALLLSHWNLPQL